MSLTPLSLSAVLILREDCLRNTYRLAVGAFASARLWQWQRRRH